MHYKRKTPRELLFNKLPSLNSFDRMQPLNVDDSLLLTVLGWIKVESRATEEDGTKKAIDTENLAT